MKDRKISIKEAELIADILFKLISSSTLTSILISANVEKDKLESYSSMCTDMVRIATENILANSTNEVYNHFDSYLSEKLEYFMEIFSENADNLSGNNSEGSSFFGMVPVDSKIMN